MKEVLHRTYKVSKRSCVSGVHTKLYVLVDVLLMCEAIWTVATLGSRRESARLTGTNTIVMAASVLDFKPL